MSLAELTELMSGLGQKPYRARQVWDALYKQRVGSLEEMTTLPTVLREELAVAGWRVGLPVMAQTAVSVDGTERYLMRMADGETVETVWMPDGDGGERGDGSEAAAEEAGEVETAEEAVAGIEADSSAALRNDSQKSMNNSRDNSNSNDQYKGLSTASAKNADSGRDDTLG
jgi:23S rRNA (adenine2503-C2)-methyltransferase